MNNVTLSPNSPALNATAASVGVSETELWVILGFMGLGTGIVTTTVNGAIGIGILRNEELRSRFFIIIFFIVLTRVIIGLQTFIVFVYRALRTLRLVGMNMNMAACYFLQVHVFYMLTLEMVLLFALVVDRTMAIAAYIYYRKLTYKHAITACSMLTIVTVGAKLFLSMIGVDFRSTVACVNSISPTSALFIVFSQYLDTALAVLIFLVYVGLICYVQFYLLPLVNKTKGPLFDQAQVTAAINQHKTLMPVLTRMVLLHCGITFTSRVAIASQNLFSPQIANRIAAYSGMLVTSEAIANTVALLFSNESLRRATLHCCSSHSQAVEQTTSPNKENKAANTKNARSA